MSTRRQFITMAGLAAAAAGIPGLSLARRVLAQVPGGSLDPTSIPKYTRPLMIPPAMPRTGVVPISSRDTADYYEIAMR